MKSLLIILAFTGFALVPLGLASRFYLVKRLRVQYPKVWNDLGQPKLFDSIASNIIFLRWLFRTKLGRDVDPTLRQAVAIEKVILALVGLVSLAYLVAFAIYVLGP